MQRTGHFFDCDGTQFRGSLAIKIGEIAMREGFLPKDLDREWKQELLAWQRREGTFDAFAEKHIEGSVKHYRNFPIRDFDRCMEIFLAENGKHEYVFTRTLIKELQSVQQNCLVMVSHSPSRGIERFAKFHGFDFAYGSHYATDGDSFTGKAEAFPKNETIHTFLKTDGYGVVVTKRSFGVGDTLSDIPMLEMVGRPVCMNPSRALAREAQSRSWLMVIERKDTIVALHNNSYRFLNMRKALIPQLEHYFL